MMCRDEFLAALRARLSGLPEKEVEDRLGFYAEMIDDRVEEGLTEEEAVLQIGSVEDVAARQVGMQVFLIDDCLLNGDKADMDTIPHGNFDDAIRFVKAL